jgi:DNA-binding transcriptional LysR family regulator
MNTYHLRYFLDAAETGSMSKAAQMNHVSHSAISQAIKALENELDVQLLAHARRKFVLTPEGELCAQKVKALLDQFQQFKLEVQETNNEPVGEVRIMAPQSLIVHSLSRSIVHFHQKYPKIQLKSLAGPSRNVRLGVIKKEIDLGILVDDGLLQDFESYNLLTGNFVLVSRKAQSLSKNLTVSVTQFDKTEVLHFRKAFRQHFGVDSMTGLEMMSWGVLKSMALSEGLNIYVPDYCVQSEIDQQRLHVIPTPWVPFKYKLKAIWPKGKLSRNGKLFLQQLKGICE